MFRGLGFPIISLTCFVKKALIMTGYTVHTGSNDKFAAGWDQIFSGGKKPGKKPAPSAKKESASGSKAVAAKKSKAKKGK